MFEIGVKVKESAILTVDVSKPVLEDTLVSHMPPVQKLNESIDVKFLKELKNGGLTVENILKHHFRNFSVKDVSRSRQKGKGDYAVDTASGREIMIEVKNRVDPVPPVESQKFEEGLEVKVGIMFFLCSGISNHS